MTLRVSELVLLLATCARTIEHGGSLPVCLSICVQGAALKAPPPFGRTLSFQNPLPIAWGWRRHIREQNRRSCSRALRSCKRRSQVNGK